MTTASSRPPVHFDAAQRRLSDLFDRLPPHSIEAEMSLLGSLILAGTENIHLIGQVMQTLRRPADFYLPKHAALYETIVELYDKNQSIDSLQLTQRLRDKQLFESVGGIDYIIELAESVPTAVNAPHYAQIVRDKAKVRNLINAAGAILRDAHESSEPADHVIDQAEKLIFEIAQSAQTDEPIALADLIHLTFEQLEKRQESGRTITGRATGFLQLDEMLSGLQPSELIILAARPSMGKCLSADSEIVLTDGRVVTIEEVVKTQEGRLLTLGDDLKLRRTKPSAYVDDGVKPVFRVTTRLGRSIKTTATHPFLTVGGWKKLADLTPGASIAVPRRIPVFGRRSIGEHRVKILGYLLGDGGLTNACPRFTSNSALLRDDFARAIDAFGGLRLVENSSDGTRAVSVSVASDRQTVTSSRAAFAARLRQSLDQSGQTQRELAGRIGVSPATITHWRQGRTAPDAAAFERLCDALCVQDAELAQTGIEAARKNAPNALTRWLEDLGLMGRGAREKFIPAIVFQLQRPLVALLLNRLFATDGWATVLTSGQSQVGYATVSERMARQVQHLLLRFGVIAALRQKRVRYRQGHRMAFQLDVTDARSIRIFIDEIGIFGKEAALGRVAEALDQRRYQTNLDLIPVEVWAEIDAARGDLSWAAVARRMGLPPSNGLHVGRRAPTRDRLWRFAQALGSPRLRQLATSDVYWDQIVSIEPLGRRQVYDLTIPDTHNFIAQDICVHNTALALNIAEYIAVDNQQPVAVFSLEMSKQQLAERLLSSRSGVDSQRMRRNMLNGEELTRLQQAADELAHAPMYIDDTPGLTVLGLRAKARRLASRHDIQCVVVDYLQLMSAPGSESRQTEVGSISRGIKALAREIGVPVVCLSQLNRNPEGRESKRPMLSDLRESGAIEQDADVVMMLHREEYYHHDDEWKAENPDKLGTAELIIAKQRNGPTGTVPLQFDGRTTRFHNLARGYSPTEPAPF